MYKSTALAAFALAFLPGIASADDCPEDGRYATNGAGQAFCLFEGIDLPEAEDLAPYCTYLDYGYIGFSWTEGPRSQGYACPEGSYYTTNGAGAGFCIYGGLDLPKADNLTAYCQWLEYGYIGYHWDICPEGARYAENGAGVGFCLFEDLELPSAKDVGPYCDYLEEGYIGFSWTETGATATYECPEGSVYADNGAGAGFCLFDALWLPPNEDLAPYCEYLDLGYIGYSWTL
jgi:hypothetical protein